MTVSSQEEPRTPIGHLKITYLGPVSPHWELSSSMGSKNVIDEFSLKIMARLNFLPPHDPQFRRNRERIMRDAEREQILLEWDLGYDESGGQ